MITDVITYGTRRCRLCPTMMVDLPGVPFICDKHDLSTQHSDGDYVQVGEVEEYVATNIEPVGLFAAVVSRYVKIKKGIYKQEHFESWIDPDTGEKMGRRSLR